MADKKETAKSKPEPEEGKGKAKEATLPPDPNADQMEAAQGMCGSTNPRQGQPF